MSSTWQLLGTRPGGTVTSLAAISGTSGGILAATPAGVRHSTDGGRSWSVLGGPLVPPIEVVMPAPSYARSGLALAGTADGLYRSTDGGATWTATLVGSRVLCIAFADERLVLVGTESDGVLRSEDAGQTWKSGNPGLLDLTVLGLACSPSFATDQTLLAATASGIFRSRNAGRAWRAVETLPGEPVVQSVAATESALLAGTEGDGLLRSIDNGQTWSSVPALAGRSVTALAVSASTRIAAATDTGVAVSDDAGATWRWVESLSEPFLCVAFTADGTLLGGLPRRGVVRSSDGISWESASTQLCANLVVALALRPGGLLCLAGLEDGLVVSSDAGASWQPVSLGEASAVYGLSADAAYAATGVGVFKRREGAGEWERSSTIPARAVASSGDWVAALGLEGEVCTSADGGQTWRTLAWPTGAAGAPTSLSVAVDGTLLVGTNAGVWRADGRSGADWQPILEAQAGRVSSVLAAPTYPINGLCFVGVGDEVWSTARGVQEVVRGQRRPAWRRTSSPGSVIALASSPTFAQDRTLAVGTSVGVALSRDAGAHWMPWSDGLTGLPVLAVAFSPHFATDHLVYAVELGGRLWRRAVD